MKKDVLTRPFPAELVKQRPGRNGQMLSYVETHAVIARLNEGCDAWSFEIISHEVQDGEVIVLGRLTADGVIKCAFGGSDVTVDKSGRVVSIADDLKAAASDALKKAASLLGVGLELYGAPAPMEASHGRPSVTPRSRREPDGHLAPPAGDRITSRQLAAVHSACRRQGLTRGQLEGLLFERFRKRQLEYLTKGEASALLQEIGAVAGRENGVHA